MHAPAGARRVFGNRAQQFAEPIAKKRALAIEESRQPRLFRAAHEALDPKTGADMKEALTSVTTCARRIGGRRPFRSLNAWPI